MGVDGIIICFYCLWKKLKLKIVDNVLEKYYRGLEVKKMLVGKFCIKWLLNCFLYLG